jgi:hypothetical protein
MSEPTFSFTKQELKIRKQWKVVFWTLFWLEFIIFGGLLLSYLRYRSCYKKAKIGWLKFNLWVRLAVWALFLYVTLVNLGYFFFTKFREPEHMTTVLIVFCIISIRNFIITLFDLRLYKVNKRYQGHLLLAKSQLAQES